MSAARWAKPGTVYLVGAGPGDPELLTVRALRLLETAEVVFHDDLVPEPVLRLIHPEALVSSVGKRCGRPRITQAGIHKLLIEASRAGQAVVRLKSGDPMIFGRAAEEIAALRRAGVPCEVVPGITAALAAGSALQLPLTDRLHASKLIFATGHHATGKDESRPIWTGKLPPDATLVVYMPGRDLGRLQRELLAAGMGAETPVAAIAHVATERQEVMAGTLGSMQNMVPGPAPVMIVAGDAVRPLLDPEGTAATVAELLHAVRPEATPHRTS